MRFRTTVLTTAAALAVVALAGCAASGANGAGPGKSWARDLPVTRLTPLGHEDGFVPEGGGLDPTDDVPALSELEPDLLAAVRAAAEAALEEAGIEVLVTSGWRSERYQRYLLESAVQVYGTEEEAARWVASPEDSSHVTGSAVDVGRTDAAYWFVEHGARFGLCQTYANEVWHYELTVEPGRTCPAPLEDASAG
ncbi:M15 family metallopeptidase [Nocardiopsis sp. SBT366]|uniref:M15 family metallopeptidase n=1 Tax=Nocardiopsis sp. SBT366 TaxID=1580529 RepID=UPI00066CA02A|nr:M15 family metallopeptidase [Nocardiopsis sp. SBT366]